MGAGADHWAFGGGGANDCQFFLRIVAREGVLPHLRGQGKDANSALNLDTGNSLAS